MPCVYHHPKILVCRWLSTKLTPCMYEACCAVCQVRLRKVERLRRDGGLSVEGLLRPRHSGMTRSSSHCSVTSSAGSLAYSLEAFETLDSFDPVIPAVFSVDVSTTAVRVCLRCCSLGLLGSFCPLLSTVFSGRIYRRLVFTLPLIEW